MTMLEKVAAAAKVNDWEIWCDASLEVGVSAVGAWLIRRNGKTFERHSIDLLHCGNAECLGSINVAELFTVRAVCRRMRTKARGEKVTIYVDATSVIDALAGRRELSQVENDCVRLIKQGMIGNFGRGSAVRWIPREQNRSADRKAKTSRERRTERVLVYHEGGRVEERSVERFKKRLYSDCLADGAVRLKVR